MYSCLQAVIFRSRIEGRCSNSHQVHVEHVPALQASPRVYVDASSRASNAAPTMMRFSTRVIVGHAVSWASNSYSQNFRVSMCFRRR